MSDLKSRFSLKPCLLESTKAGLFQKSLSSIFNGLRIKISIKTFSFPSAPKSKDANKASPFLKLPIPFHLCRATCKNPRRSKIVLLSHFAVPPSGPTLLEYVPDGGIRAAASPGKLTQNLRFFWGGDFCKWLYGEYRLPIFNVPLPVCVSAPDSFTRQIHFEPGRSAKRLHYVR